MITVFLFFFNKRLQALTTKIKNKINGSTFCTPFGDEYRTSVLASFLKLFFSSLITLPFIGIGAQNDRKDMLKLNLYGIQKLYLMVKDLDLLSAQMMTLCVTCVCLT